MRANRIASTQSDSRVSASPVLATYPSLNTIYSTCNTAASRSGSSAASGTRYGMRASRILPLARPAECGVKIVGTHDKESADELFALCVRTVCDHRCAVGDAHHGRRTRTREPTVEDPSVRWMHRSDQRRNARSGLTQRLWQQPSALIQCLLLRTVQRVHPLPLREHECVALPRPSAAVGYVIQK